MTRRIHPCVIRLYDENSTRRVVKSVLGLSVEGSYMVVGCDGDNRSVDLEMAVVEEICEGLDAQDLGSEAGEHWWKHRYDFYFPPFTLSLPKMYGTIETTTTFDRIYDIYQAKKRVIEEEFKAWNATYIAHFSHWFPWASWSMTDSSSTSRLRTPRKPFSSIPRSGAVARASIQNGGVLNDHHGIGFKLGWLMPELYGPAWPVMQEIKDAIDPQGIMNPGKLGASSGAYKDRIGRRA